MANIGEILKAIQPIQLADYVDHREYQFPLPEGDSPIELLADVARASMAKEFRERLERQIKAFDESLDQDHEVGVKLVTFGQAVTFHVTDLGYHNPSLIFFHGETAEGDRIQLIQHVSQISFVLIATKKPDPNQPARRFGFAQGHPDHDARPTEDQS